MCIYKGFETIHPKQTDVLKLKYFLILARLFGISVRDYSIIYKYLLNYMYAKM